MSTWNDDRLDELSKRMDAGFARVDREMKAGFERVDREMKAGFARVDERFERLEDRLTERLDRVVYAMVAMAVTFCAPVAAAVAGHIIFNL